MGGAVVLQGPDRTLGGAVVLQGPDRTLGALWSSRQTWSGPGSVFRLGGGQLECQRDSFTSMNTLVFQ